MSEPKAKTIKVRAAKHRAEDERAILNDQDDAHPDGYVLIVGTDRKTHTVGDTRRVRELIEQGLLDVVEETAEKKADASGTTPKA